MAVLDDIREQFPQLAWLVNDPEIGGLLSRAVDPNTTFSAQRFQAELQNTNWWRSRSQTSREWEILSNTDPGEASRQRTSFIAQLELMGNQLGYSLSGDQLRFITESAMQQGMDVNDPRIRRGIASIAAKGGAGNQAGLISTLAHQVDAVGKSEYFYKIHGADALAWADMIAGGQKTLDDLRSELQRQSISMYSHLAEELSAGSNMKDIFNGHINTIANELEISPTEIDLTQGQWLKVIATYDPSIEKHRPLTLSETRTLAREDSRFWATTNGRALDAQMSNNLLRQFGARR